MCIKSSLYSVLITLSLSLIVHDEVLGAPRHLCHLPDVIPRVVAYHDLGYSLGTALMHDGRQTLTSFPVDAAEGSGC